MRWLLKTNDSLSGLVLRLTLAVGIFPHGAQKLLGWFGGGGFSRTLNAFTNQEHLPSWLAVMVILIESLGSLALFLGLLTRLAALGVAAVMLGAIITVHAANGFFMNWSGTQAGEGFEYHILALGICLTLIYEGGGLLALDGLLSRRLPTTHPRQREAYAGA
jgi:putative oxidoreductase